MTFIEKNKFKIRLRFSKNKLSDQALNRVFNFILNLSDSDISSKKYEQNNCSEKNEHFR